MNNQGVLILYSGGADSRLMLELALKIGIDVHCLLVDYEQRHIKELEFAKKHLNQEGISFQIVSIRGLDISSGLTGDGVKNETGEVHEMHVPGRNSIFLSLALSVAEDKNIDTIWIGSDWSDRLNLFPDCYQEYLIRVNEMFKFAGPKNIKVEAPLMGLTREMVMSLLLYFHVNLEEVFSGYGNL